MIPIEEEVFTRMTFGPCDGYDELEKRRCNLNSILVIFDGENNLICLCELHSLALTKFGRIDLDSTHYLEHGETSYVVREKSSGDHP